MRSLLLSWCLVVFSSVLVRAAPTNVDTIEKSVYDNLVKYAKFAAAAYQTNAKCKKPVGLGLDGGPARRFDTGGTQGYLAVDDAQKEYILSFEGTFSPKDVLTDAQFWRSDLKIGNVKDSKASVHTGFQKAWLVVEKEIMDTVAKYVKKNPSYKWTVVGHSLGGAVASFASLAIKTAHPSLKLKLYTYGAPRVGNEAWVKHLEKAVGVDNIFRGVHMKDIVPTMLGHWLGYRHPATEYWQNKEPSSPANVVKCKGGEDPSCSSQYHIAGLTIEFDHMAQFGVSFWTNPLKADPSLCPSG